jgi:ribosome-associated translation inhibitor RaiA
VATLSWTEADVQERAEASIESASDLEDIKNALDEAADKIREVADEYQESFDATNEGLQQSQSGQDIEEKINNLQRWADSIESDMGEVENFDLSDFWESENHEGKEAPEDLDWDGLTDEEKGAALSSAREKALENIGYPG